MYTMYFSVLTCHYSLFPTSSHSQLLPSSSQLAPLLCLSVCVCECTRMHARMHVYIPVTYCGYVTGAWGRGFHRCLDNLPLVTGLKKISLLPYQH